MYLAYDYRKMFKIARVLQKNIRSFGFKKTQTSLSLLQLSCLQSTVGWQVAWPLTILVTYKLNQEIYLDV